MFVLQIILIKSPRQIDLARYLGLHPSALLGSLGAAGQPTPLPKPLTYFPFYQLLTYAFLHSVGAIFHILFNMLFLYWFGRDLEVVFGRGKYLMLYLGAGVFAGLCYCGSQYLSPIKRPVIGASGAIMGLLVCYALLFPNRQILFMFIFPMRVKYFVLLLVGIDLYYMLLRVDNGVANVAHLGGAVFGLAFLKASPTISSFVQNFRRRRQFRREAPSQEMIDRILAKINQYGIGSLTQAERNTLRKASRRYREK